jgi:excisionase family DNA binding protein
MTGMTGEREFLTIEEVLAVLRVSRSTFSRWRRQGTGPTIIRLPGGGVRIRCSALDRWLRGGMHPHGGTLRARSVTTFNAPGARPRQLAAPGVTGRTDGHRGEPKPQDGAHHGDQRRCLTAAGGGPVRRF